MASLRSTGKGAVILPHGVLFRGHAEAGIRRNLIRQGVIKGIIGLPANLFYGTGIPACIVVLDKEGASTRDGIFMIDASRGFAKDGNKNRLRSQDIHKIVDVFNRGLEVPRYARYVSMAEIEANEFNLNIPRYIDASEPEDLHDLEAHLRGGIPERDIDALRAYWAVLPTLRYELFAADRPGYLRANVPAGEVQAMILAHPEFAGFQRDVSEIVHQWRAAHEARLLGLAQGVKPKEVIEALSEDLLARFSGLPLLDQYAVYERLMEYWGATMQDDVYLIAVDGWSGAARPRPVIDDKERKITETPDLVVDRTKYKMDLLPPALVVTRFFGKERAAIEALEAARTNAAGELEAFVTEHAGEGGLLEEVTNEKGEVTKTAVKSRIKAIFGEPDSGDEREVLTRTVSLIDAEAAAVKAVKDAQTKLDAAVLRQYGKLTEDEIKRLVVCDKWLAAVQSGVEEEVQRLTNGLANRIKTLEERYVQTLPDLAGEANELARRVATHLRRMDLSLDHALTASHL